MYRHHIHDYQPKEDLDMDTFLFAGSNTCRGFFGYYDQLLKRAQRSIILKGGPGVGKSTFIREAGKHLLQKGQTVQFFACSGDPDSLDALWAEECGLLIVDGTSPHMLDPLLPGAQDGIVNLGECLNEKQLENQKTEIRELSQDTTARFQQAYRYLQAAECLMQDAFHVYREATDPRHLQALQKELSVQICPRDEGEGFDTFVQSITCKGTLQNPDLLRADQIICLDLPWGFCAHDILSDLQIRSQVNHWQHTVYHDPLNPDRIAHLQIGRTLFTTAVMMDAPRYEIDLDKTVLAQHMNRMSFNRAAYDLMLHQAYDALNEAKTLHDKLERCYIDAMNFDRLSEMRTRTIAAL